MPTSWLGRILGLFGVPSGEDPAFYRDVLLGLVFTIAAVVVIAKLVDHVTDRPFWMCLGVAALAFVLVRNKVAILLGFALIVATRLVFFWVTH